MQTRRTERQAAEQALHMGAHDATIWVVYGSSDDPHASDFQAAQREFTRAKATFEGQRCAGASPHDLVAAASAAIPPEWYVWDVARLTAEKDQLQARVSAQDAEIVDLRSRLALRTIEPVEGLSPQTNIVDDIEPHMRPLAAYRVELELREIRQGSPIIFPEDFDRDGE